MYCKKCCKDVPTKREEINWFLLVILAIFTSGFGVFIYLIIYFNKPENRCIYCNSICQPSEEYNPYKPVIEAYNSPEKPNNYYKSTEFENNSEVVVQIGKYCPSCGAKLDERGEANYCAFCGFDLS
ncbi:MAG: hypothetical protein ACQERB_09370 [Promethearchaeati archaeon]